MTHHLSSILAEIIAGSFELNTYVIRRQTAGLAHEAGLIQPPFRGNSLNWVLGHITASRQNVLKLLGHDPLWDADTIARYITGSDPVVEEGEDILPLEQLIADFDLSGQRIAAVVRGLDEAALAAVPDGAEEPLAAQLHGLLWHETYHAGQTEFLRQLAGADDKIF